MEIRFVPNRPAFKRIRTLQEALVISDGDMAGPVLVRLGQLHRKQQTGIFTSQGATGGAGRWPALNPSYKKRKGRGKILQLSGDMKKRFTGAKNPAYVQRYVSQGGGKGFFQFGAMSNVAAAHRAGNPALAPNQSAAARKVFGGRAPRLPVRDMIKKSPEHMLQFRLTFIQWYHHRVAQVTRHFGRRG